MKTTQTQSKITATNSDREIMDAIIKFEVKSLFDELYPKPAPGTEDLPF